MGIPQIILTGLYVLSLGIQLANHGKPREGNYNFWSSLLTFIIILALLIFGGFYK